MLCLTGDFLAAVDPAQQAKPQGAFWKIVAFVRAAHSFLDTYGTATHNVIVNFQPRRAVVRLVNRQELIVKTIVGLPCSVRGESSRGESANSRRPCATREPNALRRIAGPLEFAHAILCLTAAESSFVTSAALAVDGGRTFH